MTLFPPKSLTLCLCLVTAFVFGATPAQAIVVLCDDVRLYPANSLPSADCRAKSRAGSGGSAAAPSPSASAGNTSSGASAPSSPASERSQSDVASEDTSEETKLKELARTDELTASVLCPDNCTGGTSNPTHTSNRIDTALLDSGNLPSPSHARSGDGTHPVIPLLLPSSSQPGFSVSEPEVTSLLALGLVLLVGLRKRVNRL